jgi:hypothetical protein
MNKPLTILVVLLLVLLISYFLYNHLTKNDEKEKFEQIRRCGQNSTLVQNINNISSNYVYDISNYSPLTRNILNSVISTISPNGFNMIFYVPLPSQTNCYQNYLNGNFLQQPGVIDYIYCITDAYMQIARLSMLIPVNHLIDHILYNAVYMSRLTQFNYVNQNINTSSIFPLVLGGTDPQRFDFMLYTFQRCLKNILLSYSTSDINYNFYLPGISYSCSYERIPDPNRTLNTTYYTLLGMQANLSSSALPLQFSRQIINRRNLLQLLFNYVPDGYNNENFATILSIFSQFYYTLGFSSEFVTGVFQGIYNIPQELANIFNISFRNSTALPLITSDMWTFVLSYMIVDPDVMSMPSYDSGYVSRFEINRAIGRYNTSSGNLGGFGDVANYYNVRNMFDVIEYGSVVDIWKTLFGLNTITTNPYESFIYDQNLYLLAQDFNYHKVPVHNMSPSFFQTVNQNNLSINSLGRIINPAFRASGNNPLDYYSKELSFIPGTVNINPQDAKNYLLNNKQVFYDYSMKRRGLLDLNTLLALLGERGPYFNQYFENLGISRQLESFQYNASGRLDFSPNGYFNFYEYRKNLPISFDNVVYMASFGNSRHSYDVEECKRCGDPTCSKVTAHTGIDFYTKPDTIVSSIDYAKVVKIDDGYVISCGYVPKTVNNMCDTDDCDCQDQCPSGSQCYDSENPQAFGQNCNQKSPSANNKCLIDSGCINNNNVSSKYKRSRAIWTQLRDGTIVVYSGIVPRQNLRIGDYFSIGEQIGKVDENTSMLHLEWYSGVAHILPWTEGLENILRGDDQAGRRALNYLRNPVDNISFSTFRTGQNGPMLYTPKPFCIRDKCFDYACPFVKRFDLMDPTNSYKPVEDIRYNTSLAQDFNLRIQDDF